MIEVEETNLKDTMPVLSVNDLENMPKPEWLLENRLPEGQTWIYGEPGVGKTFVSLDWAASVAANGDVVIYFVGEGVKGFSKRVLAWKRAHDTASLKDFYVVPLTPQLLDNHSVEAFNEVIKKYQPRLIVIDTFARAAVGADENSAKDVGRVISVLDTIYRVHDCSSIVVHHSNKSGAGERGSGAIRGAADATWEVTPDYSHGGMTTVQIVCRKMKDAEPPRPALGQLRPFDESAVIYPSAWS
jgi:KaiC/GvpD/RAD55 family RecA-like ATPase